MPEIIGREEVQVLLNTGTQVVEVLGPREYREAHLPRAINIPLSKIGRDTATVIDPERPVIVYCHDLQ